MPNPFHNQNRRSTTSTTHPNIDENLIEEVRGLSKHAIRESAVTAALENYVQNQKRLEILDLFGTVDFDEDYDYKKSRPLDKVGIED